ncbi:hypothetical protein C8F01DRAFT_1144108 [Mycena amicta]|nr:hypothetical protein C8F01DRAFT_1144108 [Mycena amicta]
MWLDTLPFSDTVWLDPGLKSLVIYAGPLFKITKNLPGVVRIERLTEVPAIWPVPRVPTAFLVDLKHPMFAFKIQGKLVKPDQLIKNQDNDSWEGSTGVGQSTSMVVFSPGEAPVECRRSTLICAGSHACIYADTALTHIVRHELSPDAREPIIRAQERLRAYEGTSPEMRATQCINIIRSLKCKAIDRFGRRCQGSPIPKRKATKTRGHSHVIGCSADTPEFPGDHIFQVIPDKVDEQLVLKGLNGIPLIATPDADTPPCATLHHPTTGRKGDCNVSHIIGGLAMAGEIVERKCPAKRWIYVPLNPNDRRALVCHAPAGHNHPEPTLSTNSWNIQQIYEELVLETDAVVPTVAKVDNSAATKIRLDGRRPGEVVPALQSKRVKAKIVQSVKAEQHPDGFGAPGAFKLYQDDINTPIRDRYVHRFITTPPPENGIVIVTCFQDLLALLDAEGVTSFEADMTFKRVLGEFNEWEVVIYLKILQRATTIGRVYVNGKSTAFYELVFDTLREVKLELTGKPIEFKHLIDGGKLIAFNSDMDSAQVLGAARSFAKTISPSRTQLLQSSPEQIAPWFIKLCLTHAKRAVLDFKSLVTPQEYSRLMDFPYIDSAEKLEEFDAFVRQLKPKKIRDWWAHKAMSAWILPCLVKRLSPLSENDWDSTPSTTNTGESQHAWTNSQTGIRLVLVSGMLSARTVDRATRQEIASARISGILGNTQNEEYNRMARGMAHASATIRKSIQANGVSDEQANIQLEIDALVQERSERAAQLKALQAQKTALGKGSKKGRKRGEQTVFVSASSSGRVKTRTIAAPIQHQPVASSSTLTLPDALTFQSTLQYPVLSMMAPHASLPIGNLDALFANPMDWEAPVDPMQALWPENLGDFSQLSRPFEALGHAPAGVADLASFDDFLASLGVPMEQASSALGPNDTFTFSDDLQLPFAIPGDTGPIPLDATRSLLPPTPHPSTPAPADISSSDNHDEILPTAAVDAVTTRRSARSTIKRSADAGPPSSVPAPKKAKKDPLLTWACEVDGIQYKTAREYADQYPEDFKAAYPRSAKHV